MNPERMPDLMVLIVILLISAPIALALANRLEATKPQFKPYLWGYFYSVTGVVAGLIYGAVWFYVASNSYGRSADKAALWGVYCFTVVAFSVLAILRNKLGWIMMTILSANPILWVINGIYAKRRWHELSWGPKTIWQNSNARRSFLNWESLATRALVGGSALWTVLVLLFVFLFEPYGSVINDDEWLHILKIVVFFPAAGWATYFIYTSVIQRPAKAPSVGEPTSDPRS